MPFAGVGLYVFLALLCAIHAVRTRQNTYWLFILFLFPLLGSVVYLFAVYLPYSRLERGAIRAVTSAAKAIDPTREVRAARTAYEEVPTAQNQMRLAAALLDVGSAEEAAALYEGCLTGPFATDLEIRYCAARALAECRRFDGALRHLDAIRAEKPDFRELEVSLLTARCYAGTSRNQEARAQFEATLARFDTYEARAEYAIWALAYGDTEAAQRLDAELEKLSSRWNRLTRNLNEPVARRYRRAKESSLSRTQA